MLQTLEHPSPLVVFPSSQVSSVWTIPSPQIVGTTVQTFPSP